MQPHASLLVTLGIPLLALIALLLVALAIARVAPETRYARRFVTGAAAWLLLSGLLASTGLLAHSEARPPPLLLIMIPTFLLPIALAFSPVGTRLAQALPLPWLVAFHGFRLPLELVMHEAAREGTMPAQMTFTGHNFDIVTGASALLVALALARLGAHHRGAHKLALAWNLIGTLLLAVIVVVAVASLPLFHANGEESAHLNTWVAYFPFVWLPAALVSAALFGHVVLWRHLLTAARSLPPVNAQSGKNQGVLNGATTR
jgi:hypothetical protein